jgi:Arc/MetJ-type ribon-helix-helix transcriptional regulator
MTMKTLTVRLPEALVSEIEAESRARKTSKSDVVRERLRRAASPSRRRSDPVGRIADLIGSVEGLPVDLSARARHYLGAIGYGQKRPR